MQIKISRLKVKLPELVWSWSHTLLNRSGAGAEASKNFFASGPWSKHNNIVMYKTCKLLNTKKSYYSIKKKLSRQLLKISYANLDCTIFTVYLCFKRFSLSKTYIFLKRNTLQTMFNKNFSTFQQQMWIYFASIFRRMLKEYFITFIPNSEQFYDSI